MLNQDVRDAIVNNASKEHLRKMVYDKGHTVTLLQDGLEKVVSGDTTFDEIIQIIDVESDFGEDEQELKDALLGKTKQKEDEDAKILNNISGNLTEILDTKENGNIKNNANLENNVNPINNVANQTNNTNITNDNINKNQEELTPNNAIFNENPINLLENPNNNAKKTDYDIL